MSLVSHRTDFKALQVDMLSLAEIPVHFKTRTDNGVHLVDLCHPFKAPEREYGALPNAGADRNSSNPVNRWCTISGMPKLGSTFPLGRCLGRGGLKVKRLCIGSKMHAIGASDEIKREKGAGLWGFRWNWA